MPPRRSGTATWAGAGTRSPRRPPARCASSPPTRRSATSRTLRPRPSPPGSRRMAPVAGSKVFLTSGGSDSIDTATKMARRYWQLREEPQRAILIRREKAYHGMHTAGTSLAGIPANAAGHGELIEDVTEVPWNDAEALRAAIERDDPERVAAFFCEPVIGAGGVFPPPPGYLQAAREVCREMDVLFIADEVITGFGRTRRLVRLEPLRARSRHHHVRQGHHQRLPADGGGDRLAGRGRAVLHARRRSVASRLHLQRARLRGGGRARQPGHHGTRGPLRPRPQAGVGAVRRARAAGRSRPGRGGARRGGRAGGRQPPAGPRDR